ncbi:MAG: Mannose-1-phosphate guanylyltransferase RfbM [Planctomycetes bacterium]|nr:Mannose-1-phosphate guanylyltransferase RfbM [Planctomycetota bacterium]
MNLHAAILAGGSGTRFWPASTARVPKQFLPLSGGLPMLRESFERLAPIVPPERICVVTARATENDVRALLPELPAPNVLGEPAARNTAAACTLAALWAKRLDPDATLVTVPSDHLTQPAEALRAAVSAAAERADAAGTLVTLGLRPTHAATGFGWIKLGGERASVGGHAVHVVDRFVEKPDRKRAEQFLAGGGHLWNLGMFAWRAAAFLADVERHLPETWRKLAAVAPRMGVPGGDRALADAYASIPSISVDHGVMEKAAAAGRVECLPCDFTWDDMGSFAACGRHVPKDAQGNAAVGTLLALESGGNITWADDGHMTALLGVNDLIVVHAHGVTLVAPRARAEEVKKLVDALGPAGLERFR